MTTKIVLIVLVSLTSIFSFANLPEIEGKTTISNPSTLPAVVSQGNPAYIDVDGDDTYDFDVWCNAYSSSSSSYTRFIIQHKTTSGACVVSDISGDTDTKQFSTIFGLNLEVGSIIGPSLPLGQAWNLQTVIMEQINSDPHSSSFFDEDNIGYLGLKFQKGSGTQYGWLQIEVNSNNNTVTILGKGAPDEINEPAIAGDAPLAPLSFIATFLGLGVIGYSAARRKRKK